MRNSCDREADAAYISLIDEEERVFGVSREQVTLADLAEETGLDALHSLVLDFDRGDGSPPGA